MLRKTLVAGLALMLATVLAALWWRIDGERMPEFDYPEPTALPEPNAFDFLVEAADAVRDQEALFEATVGRQDPNTGEWQNPTREQMRRAVEDNQEALSLVRESLQFQFRYPNLNRVLMGEGEYRLGDLRMLARLILIEGEVHVAAEQFGPAMESVLVCLELGRKVGHRSLYIVALSGIATYGIGVETVPEIVPGLNEAELLDAIRRLEAMHEISFDMAEILQAERRHSLNYLESLFREPDWRMEFAKSNHLDSGSTWSNDGETSIAERLQMRLQSWKFHKGNLIRAFDDTISTLDEALDKPFPGSEDRFPSPDPALPWNLGEGYIEGVFEVWFKVSVHQTNHEILLATLALEAWRKETGKYPETLGELEGRILEAVPRDPFTADQPLQYRREGDGYLLYSIGPDGEDDGGTAMEDPDAPQERRYRPLEDLSGDIVAGVNVLRPGGHR